MLREIVEINQNKCVGCGLCINACHEGAIKLINGKAVLISDEYCDGLGNCLPSCPVNAIKIIKREANEYDENLVQQKKAQQELTKIIGEPAASHSHGGCNCPGAAAKTISRQASTACETSNLKAQSQLFQWPVQLDLVNANASFFENCNLLFAADCSAFAYGNFHNDFIKDHVVIIGCPKLSELNEEKIVQILKNHEINSFTAVRMEVPCCGGLVRTAKNAIEKSGKNIELIEKIITIDGNVAK